jgi:hypothetical protein
MGSMPTIIALLCRRADTDKGKISFLTMRGFTNGEPGRRGFETLIALGRKPVLVPEHKIEDGINAAHLMLKRVWFDEAKCPPGLEALRQHRVDYDEKTRAFKKTAKEDWTSDEGCA